MISNKQRIWLLICVLLGATVIGCKTQPSASPSKTEEVAEKHIDPSLPAEASAGPSSAIQSRPSGPIEFTDITSQAGIRFKHTSGAFGKKYLPETMGSGACFIDYDNDGWQDIYIVNSMDWPEHKTSKSRGALYHNNKDGSFSEVTLQAGLAIETYGMGCAVGDFDNDGNDDLYVTGVGGNHLFRNLGNGRFADVTAKAGVSDSGFATGAIWFDYDRDGKLDLFVSHYVTWSVETDQFCSLDGKNKSYCTPEAYKGESSTLFHNKGNGVFENVTKKAGLWDPTAKSLGITMLDYDDDGWMDLFVANDTQPNKLYRNNHDGTFTDTAAISGVAYGESGTTRAGMGADAGDYDHSGRQGIVVGNFTNEGLALYRNGGSGLFTDDASASGVGLASIKSLTFGSFFFDYDLDGLLDIFAANGHVADDIRVVQPTLRYEQVPHLFRNLGSHRFEDVADKLGTALRKPVVGRGAAYADIDNDGDLDLLLTSNNGAARLLRNDNGNKNDMLRVKVVGTRSNHDGIGTKLTVTTKKNTHLFAIVKSGSSYLSQSELPVTFGLGSPDPEQTVSLTVVWPTGKKESFADIKHNQSITIEEGKGVISTTPIAFVPRSTSSH